MPVPANLVHQNSTSNGVGNITLMVADGKKTFNEAFGTGGTDLFDYFITSRDNGDWEYGTGHLLNVTTLVRDTTIESSNSDAPVNFTAGFLDVTNDVTADNQARLDGAQTFTGNKTFDGASTIINSTDVRILDKNVIIGNVASPTNVTADGGGLTLKASVDKTIKYDEPSDFWKILPKLQTPELDVTSLFFTPDNGTWGASGIDLGPNSDFKINGASIITDTAGFTTLSNINALSPATEETIEDAIDSLPNLASIQGLDVSLADAGGDAFFGWDDSSNEYQNLSITDVKNIIRPVESGNIGLSGTSAQLLSTLPSWVSKIVIALDGVSFDNSNNPPMIQIGDSGGFETSGYTGGGRLGTTFASNTNGFLLSQISLWDLDDIWVGVAELFRMGDNQWAFTAEGVDQTSGSGGPTFAGGSGLKILSSALSQVRITSSLGTGNFDGGTARVTYA